MGNEHTVGFRFVSQMTITSYRHKIRTLYLFLTLTFKNPRTHPCLLYCKKVNARFSVFNYIDFILPPLRKHFMISIYNQNQSNQLQNHQSVCFKQNICIGYILLNLLSFSLFSIAIWILNSCVPRFAILFYLFVVFLLLLLCSRS